MTTEELNKEELNKNAMFWQRASKMSHNTWVYLMDCGNLADARAWQQYAYDNSSKARHYLMLLINGQE